MHTPVHYVFPAIPAARRLLKSIWTRSRLPPQHPGRGLHGVAPTRDLAAEELGACSQESRSRLVLVI